MTKQSEIINDPDYKAILDHGFIGIVDVMGDDAAIAAAARCSYKKGTKAVNDDRGLLRYLIRHLHLTPVEMCLSGDTKVHTFVSARATIKNYTIKQIADAFAKKGKENSWVKLLKIKTVNPVTGMVEATKIKNAWKTGTKKVFKIKVDDYSREIIASSEHPFLTSDGSYLKVENMIVGDMVMLNGMPSTTTETVDHIIELRKSNKTLKEISEITGYSKSLISKIGKDNNIVVPYSRKPGYFKVEVGTHLVPHAISRRLVPHGECTVGTCEDIGRDVHHKDKNPHNNESENLIRLCPKHHRHVHKYSTLTKAFPAMISSIEEIGEMDVYDLEVESDNHNFVANGFVVHNCEIKFHLKMPIFVARQWARHRTSNTNEASYRYSEIEDEFYVPTAEVIQPQSKDNKQGRNGTVSKKNKSGVAWIFRTAYEQSMKAYKILLGSKDKELVEDFYDVYGSDPILEDDFSGIAREIARCVIPVGAYTEMYWKCDLRNIMNFMNLRQDAHAQYEIRVFADAMYEMLKVHFPLAIEAYDDYIRSSNTYTLSRMEMTVVDNLISSNTSFDVWYDLQLESYGDDKGIAKHYGLTAREFADLKTRVFKK